MESSLKFILCLSIVYRLNDKFSRVFLTSESQSVVESSHFVAFQFDIWLLATNLLLFLTIFQLYKFLLSFGSVKMRWCTYVLRKRSMRCGENGEILIYKPVLQSGLFIAGTGTKYTIGICEREMTNKGRNEWKYPAHCL